ncbi:MAG: extracellular solute-binding protein family 1 [Paenibacillaceae bacterium]|jgi:multiple sugar transport system substrate-binding protein|nr:extracellular solute-binding protein family 1 [Paenibacillaceae bacterium]
MRKTRIAALLLSFAMVLAACSSNAPKAANPNTGGDTPDPAKSAMPTVTVNEPVTLKMFQHSANITDDEFTRFIADPVKKKYPNVSMEMVRQAPNMTVETIVASGSYPDLYFIAHADIPYYQQFGVLQELTPMIKKFNFPIDHYEKHVIDELKAPFKGQELYAFPFSDNFSVLFYNRDIFNQLAIQPPKDGLTWDEAIALAKVVSDKGGDKFLPLHGGTFRQFASNLSPVYVNPATQKAQFQTDQWKNLLTMYRTLVNIPHNAYISPKNANEGFVKGTVAMLAAYGARLGELEEANNQGHGVNYDLATYPVFKEKPNLRRESAISVVAVSKQSKYQDLAFDVLSILSKKETNLPRVREGRQSLLSDAELKTSFGADLKSLKGKNIAAIFKTNAAPTSPYSIYNPVAEKAVDAVVNKELATGTDANTVLRQVEETANKNIEAEKAK